jgi:hypothetical protein
VLRVPVCDKISLCTMLSLLQMACQTSHTNCTHLSLVITSGTPYLAIQPLNRADAQAAVVATATVIASAHLVDLSMTVR